MDIYVTWTVSSSAHCNNCKNSQKPPKAIKLDLLKNWIQPRNPIKSILKSKTRFFLNGADGRPCFVGGPLGTRLKWTTKLALGTCATLPSTTWLAVNGTVARLGTVTHCPSVNSAEQLMDLSRHVKLGGCWPLGTWPWRPIPEWSTMSPSNGRYNICAIDTPTAIAIHTISQGSVATHYRCGEWEL